RTIAFVNTSAVAGGALVACACDEIWMLPGSRIGLAPPAVPENEELSKTAQDTLMAQSLALLKAGVRSLCKLKNHRADVAEAFVDKDLELIIADQKVSAKGELLLLDADQAIAPTGGAPLLAKGLCDDLTDLKAKALGGAEVLELKPASETEAKPAPGAKVAAAKSGAATTPKKGLYTGKVVRITVGEEDLITPARFEFMGRTLERCTEEGAEAVIFDLDTPGGLAWQTTTLMMRDLQKFKGRTISFVNPRALSAGAMIAVATDAIYMAPASSVGGATPVNGDYSEMGKAERAKINSAFLSMARTVSKEKGHDPRVIEAMIDMDRELIINGQKLCGKGDILTLDANQATMIVDGRPLFAKKIVDTFDEVKSVEGLKGETVTAEPQGFESIAIWVTTYASVLILIGVAGAYMEMQAPGFGLPGFISIIAFGIFFFGHYVAGSLVGQEALFAGAVLITGLVFLVVELFVFPGTLIFGVLGFVFIVGSLIYTMSGWEISAPLPMPEGADSGTAAEGLPFTLAPYATAIRNVAIGFTGAVALILVMMRYLPDVGPFRRMVLATSAGGSTEETPELRAAAAVRVGAAGMSRSALRPYGTVEIDGRMVEAMVESGYLQAGERVQVREVRGSKIIVEALPS
ncbi:MAG: hypothetical protein KDK97_21195, partial [Verrucomicrobiales bacterium]|nr:hypothetical protein [Verrucomicrobiales bacterium]